MRHRDAGTIAALAAGAGLLVWGPGPAPAAAGAGLFLAGAVARPLGGLAVVAASLPLYLFPRQVGGLAVSPVEATLLLCTLAVGLRALAERRRGRYPAAPWPTPYEGPIALFLTAALLSLLVTEYFRLSLRELRTLIVEPVLFFYLLRRVARTAEEAALVLDAFLAAATAVALLAIGQFFLGGAVTDIQGVRRVQGTYSSPNHLGLLLGRAVPFLLAGAWLGRRRGVRGAAAATCLVALGLTFSLGAWLGTAAALLAIALLLARGRGLAVAAAVVGTVGLLALAALPSERTLARLDPSRGTAFVRVQLWQAGLELLAEQPLLGIGLDNFLYRYAERVPPGVPMEPNLSHPHNLVLQFWLQLGLAGVVALGWLLARFVRLALPRARANAPPSERMLAAGALASMADFVVHGAIDNSYFLVDMAFIFWLTLAVASVPGGGGGGCRR